MFQMRILLSLAKITGCRPTLQQLSGFARRSDLKSSFFLRAGIGTGNMLERKQESRSDLPPQVGGNQGGEEDVENNISHT